MIGGDYIIKTITCAKRSALDDYLLLNISCERSGDQFSFPVYKFNSLNFNLIAYRRGCWENAHGDDILSHLKTACGSIGIPCKDLEISKKYIQDYYAYHEIPSRSLDEFFLHQETQAENHLPIITNMGKKLFKKG